MHDLAGLAGIHFQSIQPYRNGTAHESVVLEFKLLFLPVSGLASFIQSRYNMRIKLSGMGDKGLRFNYLQSSRLFMPKES